MLITELDVVNDCLASMGHRPLMSLGGGSPVVSSARDAFQKETIRLQSLGWWFNQEVIELSPDLSSYVPVPADVLKLAVSNSLPWVSIRARRLYDNREGKPFTSTSNVRVVVVRLVAFEDLPYTAQEAIRAATVVRFQKAYDADEYKLRDTNNTMLQSLAELRAEHTRMVRANFLQDGEGGKFKNRVRHPNYPVRSS